MRLGGCLTVPSKPTKKTRQGLAAKALQQAQEQLRHGQGAASQGALCETQAQWHGVQKGTEKEPKMRLAGCLTVPSKPTKKTRQGLAAKALQQAQEQLRHGQGAASQAAPPLDPSAVARRAKSDGKGTEQGRSEGA